MAGYELRPVAIDRSSGRGPATLALAVGLIASTLVVKPWSSVAGRIDVGTARQAAPASAAPGGGGPRPASEAPSALGSLARHSGAWGVGASGLGPHDESEAWAEWTPVAPTHVSDPGMAPLSPSSGLCDRVPTLPADALFVAVSHETDVPIDRRVLAWWWEHGTARALEGTIHQVTPAGDRGIAYVVRDDNGRWPPGRYAFRVIGGDGAVDLAVCLATR